MKLSRKAAGLDYPASEPWTHVIRPERPWFDLRLRELWQFRDLVALLVWRDFVSVYKQTVLGPLWYVIQPVLTTVMFTVVFGRIANLSADGIPHFVFYLAGTVLWTYFATCITKTSNTFALNAALFGKVYFPRLVVPVSVVISTLVTFVIQLGLLVVTIGWLMLRGGGLRPNAWVLATPLLVVIVAALGAGLGILISAVTIRYRDLQQLVTFGVQLLMYATPVIYPVSSIGPRYRLFIELNPLTPVIEGFRCAFLGAGWFSLKGLVYSTIMSLALLAWGAIAFNRVERTFVDSV
jgi:lipopolysaccharide transport system permease protein